MNTTSIIHVISSGIIGGMSYLFGGFDLALKTMILLTVFDFLTGVITACYRKKFSARRCAKGTIKKIYVYATVALAVIIQRYIGNTIPIRDTVIVFYIISEGMSCLENIGKVIDYPPKLKEIFESLKDTNE